MVCMAPEMDIDCWSSTQLQAPTGLAAVPNGPTIDLAWNPVIDGRIMGYKIYRDGLFLAAVTLFVFTDTAPGVEAREYTVTAYTETEDSPESTPATARIEVSVSVSPTTATTTPGGSVQFSASVSNTTDQSVTWSTTAGSVSGAGLLTAPTLSASVTVMATSVVRPDAAGTASVEVAIPQIAGFNPIIEPTLPLETTATYEPNIVFEDGKFTMWYSGGWKAPGIFRAESLDGLTWSKSATPVIGQGYGGVSGAACRPTVVKVGATYYCYYASATGPGSNWMRVSSSNGVTWGSPVAVAPYDLIPGRVGFANSAVWVEDGTWYALVESHRVDLQTWAIYLMSSVDGASWTLLNSGAPLSSLQVAPNGMYGGPNLFRSGKYNGVYHLFYHAAPGSGILPTNLYHATSTDKINWTKTADPVLEYTGDGMGFDQIADPSVFESGGRLYLFYDQTDNAAESAYVGVAEIAGGIEDFLAGGVFTRVQKYPERRPGSAPTEYWNLSETSGNRIGSITGTNLSPSGSVSTTTNMVGGVAALLTSDGGLSCPSIKPIHVGNFDWTICGWIKVSNQSQAPAVIRKDGSTQKQFVIYAGEPDGLRFVVYKTDTDYKHVYGTPGVAVPNNTWVFFRAWHAAAGDVIGLQVNNGTVRTSSWTKGVLPTGTSDLVLGTWGASNTSSRSLSRFGYWKRLLSDGEAAQLYNSGLGQSWPF